MVHLCSAEGIHKYVQEHQPPPLKSWRVHEPNKATKAATFKEKAIAQFNLHVPFPEEHSEPVWKAYFEERTKLEKLQSPEDKPEIGLEIYTEPFKALIRRMPLELLRLNSQSDEETAHAEKLSDGIYYLSHDGEAEPMGIHPTADLFVRIYPRHTLTAIEGGISHHYAMHWSSVSGLRVMTDR